MGSQNARISSGKVRILEPRLRWCILHGTPQALGLPPNGLPKCEEILGESMDSGAKAVVVQFYTGLPQSLKCTSLWLAKMSGNP